VYAETNGFLKHVSAEFNRKMLVNVDKPARVGRGKVKKK